VAFEHEDKGLGEDKRHRQRQGEKGSETGAQGECFKMNKNPLLCIFCKRKGCLQIAKRNFNETFLYWHAFTFSLPHCRKNTTHMCQKQWKPFCEGPQFFKEILFRVIKMLASVSCNYVIVC